MSSYQSSSPNTDPEDPLYNPYSEDSIIGPVSPSGSSSSSSSDNSTNSLVDISSENVDTDETMTPTGSESDSSKTEEQVVRTSPAREKAKEKQQVGEGAEEKELSTSSLEKEISSQKRGRYGRGKGKSVPSAEQIMKAKGFFELSHVEVKDKPVNISLKAITNLEKDYEICMTAEKCERLGTLICPEEPAVFLISDVDDVPHDSTKGHSFYWKSAHYGVRFPLSNFVRSILTTLDIAPAQLTGIAWCHINSFEWIFRHHDAFKNTPVREPTLDLFLFYYSFVVDKSWITVRRRGKYNPFS